MPKTPEWAAEESGVEARVIRTLAREWAAKRTILSGGSRGGEGGACRQAYGTEWARMMVLLQAMQGLGAPGRSIWGTTMGAPNDTTCWFPAYGEPDGRMSMSTKVAKYIPQNPTQQRLWRLTVPDAILDGHAEWYGEGFCGKTLEQQFTHFEYPMEGCSEIKLWYRYGGSFMGTMSDTTKWVRMYQSPKLEFVVNQDIWCNSETRMADVILPACTNFERDDIGEWAAVNGYTWHASSGCNYRVIVREQKCIEPLWESKSDYEIFALDLREDGPARPVHRRRQDRGRLGQGVLRHLRPAQGGQLGGVQPARATTSSTSRTTTSPPRACAGSTRAGRATRPTWATPSASPRSAASWAPSAARSSSCRRASSSTSPMTRSGRWCRATSRSWEGYQTTELYDKYPLQLVSPHPRFSFHCHYDKHTDWLNDIPAHRIKKDGHPWWPARINPEDAAERGINNNDIVRLYNDRGSVLCIAVVTGRVRPGVIHCYASVGAVRSAAAGRSRLHGQGRVREHAHAVAHDVQERAGHDAQFLPHRDREMGGLRHGAPEPAHRRDQVQRLP